MKRYLSLLPAIAVAVALLLSSCEKAPSLTILGPTTVSLSAEGGSGSFTFTASRDWTISTPDAWLTVSPASGVASDAPVTVEVSSGANTTLDPRSATVTVILDGFDRSVSVGVSQDMIPVVPKKAFIFGNSLVAGHSFEGGESFGMCASEASKDFRSKFFNYVKSLNGSFVGGKAGASAFEILSDPAQIDAAIATYFAPFLSGDESLVVVELGDNVSPANIPVFEKSSLALLQFLHATCPAARVVWMGVWYSQTGVLNAITEACAETGSLFVPISDLFVVKNRGAVGNIIRQGNATRTIPDVTGVVEDSPGNITVTFLSDGLAYSSTMKVSSWSLSGTTLTYVGEYGVVTLAGVASHPGDAGMLAIANRLAYSLKITPDESTID